MKPQPPSDFPGFPPPLAADEIAAAMRYVAKDAPHLALALLWSIITNPAAVLNLRECDRDLIEPAQLAELADLDPALEVAVKSSTFGYVLLKRFRWTPESETAGRPQGKGRADLDVEDGVARIARWAHRVATERPDLLPALLAQLCRRTAPRLTLRSYRPSHQEILALAALAQDVEVDVDGIDAEDEPPESM